MRILHLVSYAVFSGPVAGVVGLATAQREVGHQVQIAYDRRRGAFSPYEEALCPEAHLDGGRLAAPSSLAISPKAGPLAFVADARRLRQMAAAGAIDVVHAHLSHDHWLSWAMGTKAPCRIRTVHAARALRPRLGQRWLWQRTDGVIVRAQAHLEALGAARLPSDVPRATVPGGIDARWVCAAPAAPAARAAVRAELNLGPDARVLVHVALMADRGQSELIDAFARVRHRAPAVHLVLVGLGPRERALRAQVARLGCADAVHFAGYCEAPALRRLYLAADAAFSAQAGNDAAARAALEAMAAGLPVIAVQTDALAELVDEVVGYPIASRHPDTIAAGLVTWLTNAERGVARGRAAHRRIVRRRSFAREASETSALYAQAAERWRQRRL